MNVDAKELIQDLRDEIGYISWQLEHDREKLKELQAQINAKQSRQFHLRELLAAELSQVSA